MKAIIASLICAVAIGCIGFAPSKAEAGWYGREVGISIGIGPRYGYYAYRIVHMVTTAMAIGTRCTGSIERLVRAGAISLHPSSEPGRLICNEV